MSEEIKKIDSSFSNAVAAKSFQRMDDPTAVSIGESNAKANAITFYDDMNSHIINELLYMAESGQIQNYKIKIKKVYYDSYLDKPRQYLDKNKELHVFEFVEDCIINTLQHNSPIGDCSSITISYSKSANF